MSSINGSPITDVASKLNLIPPAAEQCEHHMFHRERPEKEYECVTSKYLILCVLTYFGRPLYRKYDYGTTVFSGLAEGILTGKVR